MTVEAAPNAERWDRQLAKDCATLRSWRAVREASKVATQQSHAASGGNRTDALWVSTCVGAVRCLFIVVRIFVK